MPAKIPGRRFHGASAVLLLFQRRLREEAGDSFGSA